MFGEVAGEKLVEGRLFGPPPSRIGLNTHLQVRKNCCLFRVVSLVYACNFIKIETLAQVFSCEFCEISTVAASPKTLITCNFINLKQFHIKQGDTKMI